jgi:hypothetical protein
MLAKQLLRHESVAATEAYLHPSRDDLTDALARIHDLQSLIRSAEPLRESNAR